MSAPFVLIRTATPIVATENYCGGKQEVKAPILLIIFVLVIITELSVVCTYFAPVPLHGYAYASPGKFRPLYFIREERQLVVDALNDRRPGAADTGEDEDDATPPAPVSVYITH